VAARDAAIERPEGFEHVAAPLIRVTDWSDNRWAHSVRQREAWDLVQQFTPPQRGPRDRTQPTAEDTEALILESLANPAHRPLTIEQRCVLLGIARSTWYRHTTDPQFKARATKAFRDAAADAFGPILDVLVTSALAEGKEGHADRKLYLQLTGAIDGNGAGGRSRDEETPVKRGAEMTDQELLLAFEGRMDLLPPGLQRRLGQDPDVAKDEPPIPPPTQEAKDGQQRKAA
jgi:hypothetical protein